jgi:hypothetical protein
MFDKGTRAWVLLLQELARVGRQPFLDARLASEGGGPAHDEL